MSYVVTKGHVGKATVDGTYPGGYSFKRGDVTPADGILPPGPDQEAGLQRLMDLCVISPLPIIVDGVLITPNP